MRDADSRLIEAIVGVALAATLLLAAFSVIAQEPASADRLIVRLADWADAPLLQRTARAFPDGACSPAACGAWIVDAGAAVRAASAPAVAPAPDSAPVAVASARFAAEIATSGGGDGGGGCVVARDGALELVLPLLALWAASRLFLRSRTAHGSRRTARP
jgi:hypothetical protein